jgi:high-affinity K+ transport system ATPase subunit B
LEYIPKPGEVVEGVDVIDETNSDLEDEPIP